MASEQAEWAIDREQDQIPFFKSYRSPSRPRTWVATWWASCDDVLQAGRYADEDLQVPRWETRERPFPCRLQQRRGRGHLRPLRRTRRRRSLRETSWIALDT